MSNDFETFLENNDTSKDFFESEEYKLAREIQRLILEKELSIQEAADYLKMDAEEYLNYEMGIHTCKLSVFEEIINKLQSYKKPNNQ